MSSELEYLKSEHARISQAIKNALAREAALLHLSGATVAERHDGVLRIIGDAMEKRMAQMREAGEVVEDESDDDVAAKLAAAEQAHDYVAACIYTAVLYARHVTKGE